MRKSTEKPLLICGQKGGNVFLDLPYHNNTEKRKPKSPARLTDVE